MAGPSDASTGLSGPIGFESVARKAMAPSGVTAGLPLKLERTTPPPNGCCTTAIAAVPVGPAVKMPLDSSSTSPSGARKATPGASLSTGSPRLRNGGPAGDGSCA